MAARPDGGHGLLVVPDRVDGARSLGLQLADWIEHHLCHGPGDREGEPVVLDDELVRFLVLAYALDTNGRRLVHRAVLSRAKGRAKSELAAQVTCAEALGPVRFDHWAAEGEVSDWGYRYAAGEPVGRRVRSPLVRVLATEEGQAGNTYQAAALMLTKGPIAEMMPGLDVGLTRTFLPESGEIRPCTAGSASKDGGKESFAVSDETHLYVLPELRRMHETVSRNLVKRREAEGWMLETTTAYADGEESVAEAAAAYAQTIANGQVANRGLLYDYRCGFVPDDWDDDEELIAALTAAYGDGAGWMDLERIVAEIRDPKTRPVDARRYFLNLPPSVLEGDSWLPHGAWQACAESGVELARTGPVWVGVDVALKHDSTAIVAVQNRPDGRLIATARIWLPERGTVDLASIEAHLRQLVAEHDVQEIAYDPAYFQRSAEALTDDGLPMVEFPQSPSRMVPACQLAYEAICSARIVHDGGGLFTDQVVSAVPRVVGEGWRISKGKSRRRIDAAVALCMAVQASTFKTRPGVLESVW
ncbi:MAG: terminase TerL endonuclease subunit [Ilumatobacteraceae bacterium]